MKNLLGSDFFKKFSVYLGGGATARAISLLTFVYMGKLLRPEEYAVVVLFFLAADLISVIVRFGLSSSIMRIFRDDHKVILSQSTVLMLVLWGLSIIGIYCFLDKICSHIASEYKFLSAFKFQLCIRIIAISLIELFGAYFIVNEMPSKYVKVNIVFSLVNLVALVFLAYLKKSISSKMIGIVIDASTFSALVALIMAFVVVRKYFNFSGTSIKNIFLIVEESWVFFAKNLIGLLQTYSSRFVLAALSTSYLLGIYSFYLIVFTQLSWLFSIFNQTYIPKIRNLVTSGNFHKFLHGKKLVNKSFSIYLSLTIPTMVVVIIGSYFTNKYALQLEFLIHKEYLLHADLFCLMFLSFLLSNFRSFFEIWQYTKGRGINSNLLISNLILLAPIYFGNIYFYKLYGIYGMVINQILIYVIQFTYTIICYRKYVVFQGGASSMAAFPTSTLLK